MIEEENKSCKSGLNLSTSSRSYKPGLSQTKSVYSERSLPTFNNSFSHPSYVQPGVQANNSQQQPVMYGPPNVPVGHVMDNSQQPMMPPNMGPINPQYGYPMSMGGNPPPGFVQQPQLTPMYNPNVATLGANTSNLAPNMAPNTSGASLSPQRDMSMSMLKSLVSTNASSRVASDISAASAGQEINLTTGMLKFFNQQHQYGFLISDGEKLDVFFHYDDVKHTLLSKGKHLG